MKTIIASVLLSTLAFCVRPIGPANAQSAPEADPIMTEELMARLVKRTLESKIDMAIGVRESAILGLAEPGQKRPAKQIWIQAPDGKHYVMVPLTKGSKDIIICFRTKIDSHMYLTDITGVLRAAAVGNDAESKLITNEQAAEKFKAELLYLAKRATELPPIEATTPSKNSLEATSK